MIIVSITGPTMREALIQITSSAKYADAFEFRLDRIRDFSIPVLLVASPKPTVFTCRPEWEGGAFDGTESERLEILKYALRLGASFIDVELNTGKRTLNRLFNHSKLKSKLILSNHYYGSLPNVGRAYKALKQFHAGVLKFAFEMDDASDLNLIPQFLNLAGNDRRKAIAIGM